MASRCHEPELTYALPLHQVRYAATEIQPSKSARARGSYLRVSFKNTRETAQAINGWKLQRAVAFLENVKEHKEAVPMRRYAGSTGRCAQGTNQPRIDSSGSRIATFGLSCEAPSRDRSGRRLTML